MTFPIPVDVQNQNNEIANAINPQWGAPVTARQASRVGMLQYWRKCTKKGCPKHTSRKAGRNLEEGWIVVGPDMAAPIEHARWINSKHMTPLPQYGSMPYGDSGAANPYTRFKQLLERGGLSEFPVSQLQAYAWDKIPEVLAARPEIATARISCEMGCAGREFLTEEDYKNHITAWHGEAKGTMAIGKELGKVLQQMPTSSPDPVAIGAAVSAAIAQMMPALMASMQGGSAPGEAPAAKGKAKPDPEVIEVLPMD